MSDLPEFLKKDDSIKSEKSQFQDRRKRTSLEISQPLTTDIQHLDDSEQRKIPKKDHKEQPSTSEIMTESPESFKIDDSSKSDEKSSPRHSREMPISLEPQQTPTSDPELLEFLQQEQNIEKDEERHLYKSEESEEFLKSFKTHLKEEVLPYLHTLNKLNLALESISEISESSNSNSQHSECSQQVIPERNTKSDHKRQSSISDNSMESFSSIKNDAEPNEQSLCRPKCYMIWTPIEQTPFPGFQHLESVHYSRVSLSRTHCTSKINSKLKYAIIFVLILSSIYAVPSFLMNLYLNWEPYLNWKSHIYQNDQYNITINDNIMILSPSADLKIQILNHNQVLEVLTEYLQQESPLLKVVALIRDTNVEKSYTVDIIKKKFRRRKNSDLSSLYPNFVVLENLRAENSMDVINYVKTFQEAYSNRQITLLAVFKVELSDDASIRSKELNRVMNTISNTFIEENIIIKIIPYEPLRESVLEENIIKARKSIGQSYTQNDINIIKQNLVEDDTECKRAYDL